MEFESYKNFWNHQAATPEGALAGVDGSASEDVVRMTGAFAARQLRASLALESQHRVLELGCGVGRIGRELAPDVAHWHGVDISQHMIDVAKDRLAEYAKKISLTVLDRTSLEALKDNTFDRAYCIAVLCHMDKEDLYLYLKELRRVVRPEGLIHVETWNLNHPMGWRRWEFEVNNWSNSDQGQRKNVSRNQFCTADEFRLYAEHAGWDVLALNNNSPWLQIVAGNGMRNGLRDQHVQRLEQAVETISYSAEFSELFGDLLDVIYGVTAPGVMLDALDQRDKTMDVEMFRTYLLALWKQGEAHWGPTPEA